MTTLGLKSSVKMESATQNQSPHMAATQIPVTQTPTMQQEVAPKPAHHKTSKQLNFPFFENYMKMARFNSSEQDVLERCLIPLPASRHRSSLSNSTVIKYQGIDSMSHLLDLDDDYLLKTLEGDSDFSDSISAISSLSLSSKRKKKRSERWRTNSRRASANALIIMKHEETHQHSTEQNMRSSERVSSRHSNKASQQHTPRHNDMSDGEEQRSHHSIPRSYRSNHSHHGTTRSHHSSAHSQHSNHSFHGSHSAAPTRRHDITAESEEKTTTSWSDRIVNADNDNFQQGSNSIKSSRPSSANLVKNNEAVEGHSRPSSGGQRRRRWENSQGNRRHSDSESDSREQHVFEVENNSQGEKVQGRSRYRDKEGHSRHRERKKEASMGENEKESRRRKSNQRKEDSGREDHREDGVRDGDRGELLRRDHSEERSMGRSKKSSRHRRDKDNSGSSNDQILQIEYNEKLGRNMRATARKERRKLND